MSCGFSIGSLPGIPFLLSFLVPTVESSSVTLIVVEVLFWILYFIL